MITPGVARQPVAPEDRKIRLNDIRVRLATEILAFDFDPLGFVHFVYPWGRPGTLIDKTEADPTPGPDLWQSGVLNTLGSRLREANGAVQIAVASGHGVGKTALVSWVIHWFMSTRQYPQIVVTANTQTQLTTKTWRELSRWHNLMVHKDWFNWTATRFYNVGAPSTWFASAIPWSENRSEAFAGTHERDVLMIFDEASAIPDTIWDVASGAMTTPGSVWLAFGNPTMNTGRFKECFGKYRHRWTTFQVDSRTAKQADKKQIQQWAEDYGEDSDFFRVRVKGEFPRTSSMQFIGQDIVEGASGKSYDVSLYRDMPVVMGVDVARFGDDQTVFYVRQGLKTLCIKRYREIDTMTTASLTMAMMEEWNVDMTFVDVVGIGAGVVDRLYSLGYDRVVLGVNGGATATDKRRYFNKRAEMWGKMKEWLVAGGQIPNDVELKDDLCGPEYWFTTKEAVQLEKKDDMKLRGLASPDSADGLALTFAMPFRPRVEDDEEYRSPRQKRLVERGGRSQVTGY